MEKWIKVNEEKETLTINGPAQVKPVVNGNVLILEEEKNGD